MTEDEKKEWKQWLAVDKSDIDREDREESDLKNDEEQSDLKHASEFYSGLQLKAENLVQQFREGDGNINDVVTVRNELDLLVFPHIEDATT